jgi:hypothetical protein
MIDNGLLGKVVKTDNVHFIGFLYPDFPCVGYLAFGADIPGIIYTGREHLSGNEKTGVTMLYSKDDLVKMGLTFISICALDGKYDIDLTKTETVLDLVYSKWGLDYTEYLGVDVRATLMEIDKQDFLDFVKPRWWCREYCTENNLINLYTAKNTYNLLNSPIDLVYDKVLSADNNVVLDTLELSIINLIASAKTKAYNLNKTDGYNVTLKGLDISTKGREKELGVTLSKYRKMEHSKKFKLLWLVKELKKYMHSEVA